MSKAFPQVALAVVLATVAGCPTASAADAGLAMANSNACMACHQVDSRRVGPPLREVAARYAGSADEAATLQYLADAIRQGGRGRWGAIPMPAQPQVDAGEARELAQWILSLQPR